MHEFGSTRSALLPNVDKILATTFAELIQVGLLRFA
jgi:hypothetical protein